MPKPFKIPKIPPPKKRGPKASCECGVCPACLNRIRVLRHYYLSRYGKDSDSKEIANG